MGPVRRILLLASGGLFAAALWGAPAPAGAPSDDDLYNTAKELFDQYAPPEVKQQYDFPTKQDFEQFLGRLQHAIDSGSIEDLAGYEPQARQALVFLRTMPEYAQYADWLEAKIDELDAAKQIVAESRAPAGPPRARRGPGPGLPGGGHLAPAPQPARGLEARIPFYDRWYARLRTRPAPENAPKLMPDLESAFAEQGVPRQLAWIAEAESSLNPSARSPAGARGLFQLKSDTARALGLSTFLPDERTDPDKSAKAAAKELRRLGERFGSWPLAIAAYNAGEGRVRRLLASRDAKDYAGIAGALPGETRMYVPKVCALIAVRSGTTIAALPPPS
jgi:membrane-bound lytic murein transglycosylase D